MAHCFCLWVVLAAPVPVVSAEALRKEQEAAWVEIGSVGKLGENTAQIYLRRHDAALAFLKEKMKPLLIDVVNVKRNLVALESNDEKIWKPAFENLNYFDPRLAMTVPQLYDTAKEGKARERVMAVLRGLVEYQFAGQSFEFVLDSENRYGLQMGNVTLILQSDISELRTFEFSRLICGIQLLERMNSPRAVELIQTMATGHPKASPTIAAKEALARMKAK